MESIPDSLIQDAKNESPAGIRAASRLMTILENDPGLHLEFLQKTGPLLGPRIVLGITGAPGSGKSTLTDALLAEYRKRDSKIRIGVIAIDPSSPFSGGAILADRVRMMRHAPDTGIFIRSMASRGHLGGLARGVDGVLGVMAWMGLEIVIIETVGVGQSEVEIVRAADSVAVVLAPGFGDSMQLLKAGLMEIGEMIIINKADREGAESLHAEVLAALQFDTQSTPREVLLVSATEQKGISEMADLIEAKYTQQLEARTLNRAVRHRSLMKESLLQIAEKRLRQVLQDDSELQQALQLIENGEPVSRNQIVQQMLKKASKR